LAVVKPEEIVAAFAFVPEVRVTALRNRITVYVPAIGDSAHFVSDDVQRVSRIYAPDGSPALEFVIGDGSRVWPFIVTGSDVVFEPEREEVVLDSAMRYSVTDMPPLVAYSEMLRDAEWSGRGIEAGEINYDAVAGTFLRIRCFIVGAARFGMRPLSAVGWWERGWRRIGDDVGLPPWRVDPLWSGLVAEADQLRVLMSTVGAEPERPDARLSVVDFERLEPDLTVVGLDDEFVASWLRWIRIMPANFRATVARGVPGANADVSLYPDGGGGIDLWIPLQDGQRAFLQLRFSFPTGDMSIDEIRIPEGVGGGLFQRLLFNTEQLAALLGLKQVSLHATGVGTYALAGVGVYPRDPELYRATRDRR
jgi:hypothetical protein